ncbi:MAG: Flp pilus assembly protein CpaB [Negativicutes bacterium]|nr:Flp pilus assembly protein CpaB [Negativicutes bacterium]
MAKLSGRGLMVIALILSLLTTGLVYSYLKGVANQAIKPGKPVIVAKVDIPPKTVITPEMVQESSVPAEYIQPGAIVATADVVGVTSREQIVAGEQITQRRLAVPGQTRGFAGTIPNDKRAMTVAVTEVTGVAGFVKAGDYVDVLVTFDTNTVGENVSQIVLQNLLVLAADRETEAGQADAGKEKKETTSKTTVTLAVTPEEAAKLTVADEKGKIRMALRPYIPSSGAVAANGVTPKELVGSYATSPKGGSDSEARATAPPAKAPAPPGPIIQVIRGTKLDAN